MDAAREEPRTRMVTERAYREKYTAACPAELAPPTMYTSWSAQAGASDKAEP